MSQAREVDGFRFVASSLLRPAWVCETCGGAVLDYEKHARWHRALRVALTTAGSPFGPADVEKT